MTSLEASTLVGISCLKTISAYFLGCWIILGLWEAPLSCVGIGFSWKDLTASAGKADSSVALAPLTITDWKKCCQYKSF